MLNIIFSLLLLLTAKKEILLTTGSMIHSYTILPPLVSVLTKMIQLCIKSKYKANNHWIAWDIYFRTRMAGLCGLRGVIKKIGHQDGIQLNIWDIDHMNKIVPPCLFNMQESW